MKAVFRNLFLSLPLGARVLVLLYALGFPLSLVGHYTNTFELYDWFALWPALVRKGEVWGALTYAFLPAGVIDWAVSLFWLATLVSVVARTWSGRELWTYCLLGALASALVIIAVNPSVNGGVVGNGGMIFALLAAWYLLYGHERILLLGIGEMSVRQAAILVAVVDVAISFFCLGWLVTLAMMSGGVAGWLYLMLRGKQVLKRRSQVVGSERIARLEL